MSSIEKAVERLNREAGFAQKQDKATLLPLEGKKASSESPGVETEPRVQLNFKALARGGYLIPDAMQGSLAEQYRLLKRPLLKIASGRDDARIEYGNLIAVTSALPGEGKTFTAFNLAMSIAMERDMTVLLVDSDLMRRSLTHLVGLDDVPGLTDILIDPQVSLDDVIVSTNVSKFKLLPAGRVHRDVTELLASERMRNMAHELSTRHSNRVILFDTSPILSSSQASVLTALVGQIVVVVEEGKTSQHAIQDAVSLLDKDKVVGMVLNKSLRLSRNEYYPYYGTS